MVFSFSWNRSIDEDLRCAHWGTKRFYWSPSLQGVSGLYRGWAAWAVPVAPCCGGITGWRPICPAGASYGGQAGPGWWPLPPMTFLCSTVCLRWLALFKQYCHWKMPTHITGVTGIPDIPKKLFFFQHFCKSNNVRCFYSWKTAIQPISCETKLN